MKSKKKPIGKPMKVQKPIKKKMVEKKTTVSIILNFNSKTTKTENKKKRPIRKKKFSFDLYTKMIGDDELFMDRGYILDCFFLEINNVIPTQARKRDLYFNIVTYQPKIVTTENFTISNVIGHLVLSEQKDNESYLSINKLKDVKVPVIIESHEKVTEEMIDNYFGPNDEKIYYLLVETKRGLHSSISYTICNNSTPVPIPKRKGD